MLISDYLYLLRGWLIIYTVLKHGQQLADDNYD